MKTNDYIPTFSERIKKAEEAIENADAIVVGAGAGLSTAAGLLYSGPKFEKDFSEFIAKYRFTDLYTSSFYPFATEEERWAYWAKHIYYARYEIGALPLYTTLLQLLQAKNYFVITTNVDAQFEKAGFDLERIFAVQGDYAYIQCIEACHNTIYNNEEMVYKMLDNIHHTTIPSELVPICAVCGKNMDMHLRKDELFVTTPLWEQRSAAYTQFITQYIDKKIVYLELGVGYNTPAIIRYPFEKFVYRNPDAKLIRFNKEESAPIEENAGKTISFSEDIQEVVTRWITE